MKLVQANLRMNIKENRDLRMSAILILGIFSMSFAGDEDEVANSIKAVREVGGWVRGIPVHSIFLVEDSRIDDFFLSQLRPFTELKHLELVNVEVGDDGLKHLIPLKKITYLELTGTNVTNDGMAHIRKLKNIESLILSNTHVGDEGLKKLAALEHIEHLRLDGTKVTDEGMGTLTKWKIAELNLSRTAITDKTGDVIAKIKAVKKLSVRDTRVGGAFLKALGGLETLEHLGLSGTRVGDVDLIQLKSLPSLLDLDISENRITDVGMAHLEKMRKLKKISLASTPITGKTLSSLPVDIQELDLSESKVTSQSLKALAEFRKLRVLHLNNLDIDDFAVQELTRCSGLQELWILGTRISEKGISKLKAANPKLRIH